LSGVLTAVVLIPDTSLPACGSVIARQIHLSPLKTGPITFYYISLSPYLMIGGSPIVFPTNKAH